VDSFSGAGHLLQTGFGIVLHEKGVDPQFIQALNKPEFNVERILDLDPEHAAQVLISLQENAEAARLVERLESGAPEDRQSAGRELSDLALKVVTERQDEAERKAREVEDTLLAVRAELEKKETALAEAQSQVQELESQLERERAGVLERIWRAIFGKQDNRRT
jgi:50S ribosomal subunit-associated GTPase HflX